MKRRIHWTRVAAAVLAAVALSLTPVSQAVADPDVTGCLNGINDVIKSEVSTVKQAANTEVEVCALQLTTPDPVLAALTVMVTILQASGNLSSDPSTAMDDINNAAANLIVKTLLGALTNPNDPLSVLFQFMSDDEKASVTAALQSMADSAVGSVGDIANSIPGLKDIIDVVEGDLACGVQLGSLANSGIEIQKETAQAGGACASFLKDCVGSLAQCAGSLMVNLGPEAVTLLKDIGDAFIGVAGAAIGDLISGVDAIIGVGEWIECGAPGRSCNYVPGPQEGQCVVDVIVGGLQNIDTSVAIARVKTNCPYTNFSGCAAGFGPINGICGCPDGYYQNGQCLPCAHAVGTYSQGNAATADDTCVAYSSTAYTTDGLHCTSNVQSALPSMCCPHGQKLGPDLATCEASCNPGQVSDAGPSTCTICLFNTVSHYDSPGSSQGKCEPCPTGSAPNSDASACVCPNGNTYNAITKCDSIASFNNDPATKAKEIDDKFPKRCLNGNAYVPLLGGCDRWISRDLDKPPGGVVTVRPLQPGEAALPPVGLETSVPVILVPRKAGGETVTMVKGAQDLGVPVTVQPQVDKPGEIRLEPHQDSTSGKPTAVILVPKQDTASPKYTTTTLVPKQDTTPPRDTTTTLVPKQDTASPKYTTTTMVPKQDTTPPKYTTTILVPKQNSPAPKPTATILVPRQPAVTTTVTVPHQIAAPPRVMMPPPAMAPAPRPKP